MVIVMEKGSSNERVEKVEKRLEEMGFRVHLSRGVNRTIMGVIGSAGPTERERIESLPGVERVVPIMKPFKMASREFKEENTIVRVGNVAFGDGSLVIAAGPCAVEGYDEFLAAARAVKAGGADLMRGGAFKPRTSPYSFQGLGEDGLKIMAEAREITGLPFATEVMDQRNLEMVAEYSDIIQIGARNMQNFFLLKELGQVNKPILLKRGLSATIEEWLMAAEYVLNSGNPNVILCERGIRTFETYTRNTLDLSAIALVKQLSHLPVIVDPSHGTGKRSLVEPMALAAVAAGTDGLIVEVHPNPDEALSDGPQSLYPEDFARMVKKARIIKEAVSNGVH